MTPERWAQIEAVFHRVAECEPGQRSRLLNQLCDGDSELRQEVEVLLASDSSAGGRMQEAVHGGLDAMVFPLIGKTVSHYRILDGLGGGGMGLVYRAEDIKLGRLVALKFLPEDMASDPSARERFEREARAASTLDHRNICSVYEFGEHESQPFIVMQLLEGHTLRERIAAGTEGAGKAIPVIELLDYSLQIITGLQAAHAKGIVHRDIKPANVFITTQGEAKILDFGIAKLLQERRQFDNAIHSEFQNDARLPQTLGLTQTGSTVGTASYMSPEQIRGEPLDARTDIFSFGLILYEMATGQHAFGGETVTIVRDSILHRSVPPARQINAELPAKLEQTIARCLEKDREVRFQSAPEVRTAIESLKGNLDSKISRRRRLAFTVGLVALAVTFAVLAVLFRKNQAPVDSTSAPQLKLRELTFNSELKGDAAGMISPDGKYLAYKDTVGVHVQLLSTGESHLVEGLPTNKVDWELAAWFPDSASFLLNSHPPGQDETYWSSEGSAIWIASVVGGTPRQLRDTAYAYSVSPDGNLISFGTNKGKWGDREIWLMDMDGSHPKKLFESGEDSSIGGLIWPLKGPTTFYQLLDASGVSVISRDINGGAPKTVVPSSLIGNPGEVLWLPDGRFLYTSYWLPKSGEDCTISQIWFEASADKPRGKPSCLAKWPATQVSHLSATADGKQVAFRKLTAHNTVYIADLDAKGFPLPGPRQFALTESLNLPACWTHDGKALIMMANRNGMFGIYKQVLNEDAVRLLVPEAIGLRDPLISPDGNWLFYLRDSPTSSSLPNPSPESDVLRVPVSGGSSELVNKVPHDSWLECAKSGSHLCLIVELSEDRNQRIIYAFDLLKGRGPELARIPLDPTQSNLAVTLSPDGSQLAVLPRPQGPIQILSLNGKPPRQIDVKGWTNAYTIHWAADGRGLLISNGVQGGAVLLRVDLRGNAQVLWRNKGVNWTPGLESPDGRHLAFQSAPIAGNMWMIENF